MNTIYPANPGFFEEDREEPKAAQTYHNSPVEVTPEEVEINWLKYLDEGSEPQN